MSSRVANCGKGIEEEDMEEITEKEYIAKIQNKDTITQIAVESDPKHNCEAEGCAAKYLLHIAAKNGNLSGFKESLKLNQQNRRGLDCSGSTILHYIASNEPPISTELFDHFDEGNPENLRDKNYLNAKDSSGKTALHYAVQYLALDLSHILLSRGAAHTLTDNDGEIPLTSGFSNSDHERESYYETIVTMLNLLQEDDLKKFGSQILFKAAHLNTNPDVLDYLLKRIQFKGLLPIPDKEGNPGFTLLHKSVYWTMDDQPEQVECFRRLLAVLDYEDVNAVSQRPSYQGRTALHIAVMENSVNVFKLLLENDHVDLFAVDNEKKSILHIVIDDGWSVGKEQCLVALLTTSQLKNKVDMVKLLQMKNDDGETALEVAVRKDSVPLSRMILLAYPYEMDALLEHSLMKRIYEKVPEIMIPLMSTAIEFDKKNYETGNELFESDLKPVIGYGLNEKAAEYLDSFSENPKSEKFPGFKRETDFLSIILESEDVKVDERAAVLDHPLVQLFIHEKWQRLDEIFWFSFGSNVILLTLYTVFVTNIFWYSCPYKADGNNNCKASVLEIIASCLTLMAQLTLFLLKLIVDFLTTGFRYIFRLENLVQLLYTVGVGLVVTGIVFQLHAWHQWVASYTVLMASFLAFSQLLKIPSLGIYADIFYRVLKKMIRLMVTFSPLLIGFTVAISLVFPEYPKLANLPYNIIKILIMMTGEINYDDVFFSDYKTPFRIYAILLYALFAIIVSIVIFNLLLGFTISDIQALQNESELQILTSTLGQIVVFERLVFSKLGQAILPATFLRRYLVVDHNRESTSWKEYSCSMEKIPVKLRRKIIELWKNQDQTQKKTEAGDV